MFAVLDDILLSVVDVSVGRLCDAVDEEEETTTSFATVGGTAYLKVEFKTSLKINCRVVNGNRGVALTTIRIDLLNTSRLRMTRCRRINQ